MSVWKIIYILDREQDIEKELEVFADSSLQAIGNAMALIQIVEQTTKYSIKDVKRKKV